MKCSKSVLVIMVMLLACSCSAKEELDTISFAESSVVESETTANVSIETIDETIGIEDTENQVTLEYNQDTELFEGRYEEEIRRGSITVNFSVKNLSADRTPDTVNIYTCRRMPQETKDELRAELFSFVESEVGPWNEFLHAEMRTAQYIENESFYLGMQKEFETYRLEDNDTVEELYSILSSSGYEGEITPYAFVYDFLPMNYNGMDIDESEIESNMVTNYCFRYMIDEIPYASSFGSMVDIHSGFTYNGVISKIDLQIPDYTGEHDGNSVELVLPFMTDYEVVEENLDVVPLDACIDESVEEIISIALSPDDRDIVTNVYAAELIYVPIQPLYDESDECTLLPVWAIYWQYGTTGQERYCDCSYIDATTGELLY